VTTNNEPGKPRPRHRRTTTGVASRSPQRRDSRATLKNLLHAVGVCMSGDNDLSFNLADVARAAGTSTATVYRYFHSVDEAIDAYLAGFVDDVDRLRAARPLEERVGVRGLHTLSEDWVSLFAEWGTALVHIRSPRGFLARYREGDRTVAAVSTWILEAIRTALPELGRHDPSEAEVEFALLLWNAIFDQRELIDLERVLGWSPALIAERLTRTFIAAIAP
jgi:AcrR family transcriptional regulator